MNKLITGIASDPQKNMDFYAGILGLRLVKKIINFDAPDVYHFYYGNENDSPGTILTFFPYPGIPQGKKGKGQLTVTTFSISKNAVDYWIKRFDKFNIAYKDLQLRFEELFIYFEDHDGLGLELVVNKTDTRPGFTYGNIPSEFAIKGFYSITLAENSYKKTAALLIEQIDHKLIIEEDNRFRFSAGGHPETFVDILCSPDSSKGSAGYGTIHHVAFATTNKDTQLEAREKLLKFCFNVPPS